jgi:hypothetical protein
MKQDQLDVIRQIAHAVGRNSPWAAFLFFLKHETYHGDLTEADAAEAYDAFHAEFHSEPLDPVSRLAQISKVKRHIREAKAAMEAK